MSNDIKSKILDAALEIVATNKISGTRMHLIAKEAGMVQSNLHYYFPTKKDLMIALLDRMQEHFSQKRVNSVDLIGIFQEKKDDIVNHEKIDFVQLDYWVQSTVDPEIREKFQTSFNIWRENITEVLNKTQHLENNNSTEYAMLPYIIVSIMMGASMQYLIDKEKFNLDDYFSAAEKMVLKFIT